LVFVVFVTSSFQGRQEDAQEFLSCILNGMHEEMLQLSQMISGPVKGKNWLISLSALLWF